MAEDKLMGTLAYVFGLLSGAIIYVFNKDKSIRFHSIQSMLLCMLFISMWACIGLFAILSRFVPHGGNIILIGFFVISIGLGGIWIVITVFLMFRAYSGKNFMLPVFGKIAERLA